MAKTVTTPMDTVLGEQAPATEPEVPAPPSDVSVPVPEPEEKPMFKFYCIRCGQKLEAKDPWVGKKTTCPSCMNSLVVPEPPPA